VQLTRDRRTRRSRDRAASSICSRPASDVPTPASSFSASAACIVPMMPTSGANTPIVAQRVSSNRLSGGNRHA
jgi:hypothetical protein